jgi:hypothetical protein
MDSFHPIYGVEKAAKLSQSCGLYVARQAAAERGQAKNEEQSRNVYENKQNAYILPAQTTRIVGHFSTKRHESSDIFVPIDTNRRTFCNQMT